MRVPYFTQDAQMQTEPAVVNGSVHTGRRQHQDLRENCPVWIGPDLSIVKRLHKLKTLSSLIVIRTGQKFENGTQFKLKCRSKTELSGIAEGLLHKAKQAKTAVQKKTPILVLCETARQRHKEERNNNRSHLHVLTPKLAMLIFTTHCPVIADQCGVKNLLNYPSSDSRRHKQP